MDLIEEIKAQIGTYPEDLVSASEEDQRLIRYNFRPTRLHVDVKMILDVYDAGIFSPLSHDSTLHTTSPQ